ncbi:MAG: SRPBCC family protein, partial [Bacillota bacterium]
MQVTGEFRFDGSREEVWALLNEEEVLARCTPGCEQLVRIGEDTFRATLTMGLAAVKGTYEGTLRLTEKQPPESMALQVEGSGSSGFVTVTGRWELQPVDGGTRLTYLWDVSV